VMWKGMSGMDAARGALGQGWPFAAGPWNVTRAREPRRSRGRMQGQAFLVPFGGAGHPGDCQKGLAQQGETTASAKPANQGNHANPIQNVTSKSTRYLARTNAGWVGSIKTSTLRHLNR